MLMSPLDLVMSIYRVSGWARCVGQDESGLLKSLKGDLTMPVRIVTNVLDEMYLCYLNS